MRTVSTLLLLLVAMACGEPGGELSLVVDLRTDLVPGVEFFAVRTELVGERDAPEIAALRGQSFLDGRRVAELDGLSAGRRTARVVLLDADGGLLVEQRVPLDHSADRGITVVVTRSCVDLTCPAAGDAPDLEACLGGQCVPASCVGPEAEGCPPPACTADADCAAVPCARGRCVRDVCLVEVDDGLCASGERCDAQEGCMTDTFPGDAGADAGMDAGASPVSVDAQPAIPSIAPGASTSIDVSVRNDSDAPVSLLVRFDVPRFGAVGDSASYTCTADVPMPHAEDDFNRPDQTGGLGTTPTGDAWLNLRGVPAAVVSNEVAFTDTNYTMASVSAPAGTHGTVAATIVNPGDEAFVVARIRDDSNYVRFGHQAGSGVYELQNIIDTSIEPFDRFTSHAGGVSPAPGDRIELSVEPDGSILTFVNGRLFFEASFIAGVGLGSAGLAGLERASGTRIDDFKYAPTPAGDTCLHVVTNLVAGDSDTFEIVLTAASPVPAALTELSMPFRVGIDGRVVATSTVRVDVR